jgi:hypothetical protein
MTRYPHRHLHTMFDPVGPNVSTFAAAPFAAHARPYRQNLCVIGKSLYRNLRFIPAFRPTAENEQMCNAVGFNAPDGIPSPLHAMHLITDTTVNARLKYLSAVPDCLCRFSDADRLTPRGLQWKMSTNCAFFSLARNSVFSRASPRCLVPWEHDRRTKLRSFPRSLRGHRRDAVCGERTFGLIQNFALASLHAQDRRRAGANRLCRRGDSARLRRFEASVAIVERQSPCARKTPANLLC